uniref:Uncharacterized protein n=1 Tax=Salix viminalis TaxID=40686 RepID=A0A6N2NCY2_SALVM
MLMITTLTCKQGSKKWEEEEEVFLAVTWTGPKRRFYGSICKSFTLTQNMRVLATSSTSTHEATAEFADWISKIMNSKS